MAGRVFSSTGLAGLSRLKQYHSLRQREIFCPVAKVRVMTSPLTVGDDLRLRTMVATPELYDQEIAALIYDHVEFPTMEKKPSFDEFCDNISSFDRRVILYGIYSTTYDKVSEDTIKCPNCGNSFKDVIKSSEIIHEDSFQVWDKEEPFTTYRLEVPIHLSDENNTINNIIFSLKVPSIRDHFKILRFVSPEKIKLNYDKTGDILTKSEQLVLITDMLKIESTIEGNKTVDVIPEFEYIYEAIDQYISPEVVNKVIDEYNKEFERYSPKFEKRYQCSRCYHDFNIPIQLEVSLFRNFFGLQRRF